MTDINGKLQDALDHLTRACPGDSLSCGGCGKDQQLSADDLRTLLQWQPIETAPKDGKTPVDLGGIELRYGVRSWVRKCDALWLPIKQCWYGSAPDGEPYRIDDETFWPSHWMPVPKPPGDRLT